MATRTYHHGNLRVALLDRAEQTLRERGVAQLSLRELARDVGVSHAAPRRHFADRQALLDALAENGFDRLGRELEQAIAAAGPAWRDRLGAFAGAYVRFATEHAALLELMFAGKHSTDAVREAADRAFAAPLAVFVDGQAEGELLAGDPALGGTIALATLQGIAALANNGMLQDAPLEDFVHEALDRLLLGLRPR